MLRGQNLTQLFAAFFKIADGQEKACADHDPDEEKGPERRAEMGRIGRQRVVDVRSWDHEVPRLLAAYDQLFEG